MSVERAVFARLNTIPGFTGGNAAIYALAAPQKATDPYIIYQRTDTPDPFRDINNNSTMQQALFQIDVYAGGYFEGKAITRDLMLALKGFSGEVTHDEGVTVIRAVSCENSSDTLDETDDPRLYRTINSFLISFHEGE